MQRVSIETTNDINRFSDYFYSMIIKKIPDDRQRRKDRKGKDRFENTVTRKCLRCGVSIKSEHSGYRLCGSCNRINKKVGVYATMKKAKV